MPPLGRIAKRSKAAESTSREDDTESTGIELVELPRAAFDAMKAERAALFSPIDTSTVYDMRVPGEKERLGRDLWTRMFGAELRALRDANPELATVLRAQITNTSEDTEHALLATERYIDGMLLDVCRAQNKFKIPLLTAAASILGECNKVAREYHDVVSLFHRGAATSENWVTDFLPVAMAQRPDAEWDAIPEVAVCCFDNLSMQIDYKSYSSDGETGRRLDMTTWFSTRLPRYLAPTLDATAICSPLSARTWYPAACAHAHSTEPVQFVEASFARISRCAPLGGCSIWTVAILRPTGQHGGSAS